MSAHPARVTSDPELENPHRVVIRSVGSAVPASAASVAAGLGVPVRRVVEAFYRAPAVLVDQVSPEIADSMAKLLGELGYEADAEPETVPRLEPEQLFDVAVHVENVQQYAAIVAALSRFIGSSDEEAARLLSTPPAIVLGGVSAATVAALKVALGAGASVVHSDPDVAAYDLFLAQCEPRIADQVLADLRRRGHEPLGRGGCILTGLERVEADGLWAQHQKTGALRVVNRDFLRFDVVLTGPAAATPTAEQTAALTEVAGIPEAVVPAVFGELPITLMDAVPSADLPRILDALAAAGLEVSAELVTFLHLGLEIVAAESPRRLQGTLTELGILKAGEMLPRLPFRLPYHMPELQARLMRDSLAGIGVRAMLVEAPG